MAKPDQKISSNPGFTKHKRADSFKDTLLKKQATPFYKPADIVICEEIDLGHDPLSHRGNPAVP